MPSPICRYMCRASRRGFDPTPQPSALRIDKSQAITSCIVDAGHQVRVRARADARRAELLRSAPLTCWARPILRESDRGRSDRAAARQGCRARGHCHRHSATVAATLEVGILRGSQSGCGAPDMCWKLFVVCRTWTPCTRRGYPEPGKHGRSSLSTSSPCWRPYCSYDSLRLEWKLSRRKVGWLSALRAVRWLHSAGCLRPFSAANVAAE